MADIVDTAVNAGSFSTLVDAIKAANLIDTLKSVDLFIASTSTDQAFAKLPPETIERLLKNINQIQEHNFLEVAMSKTYIKKKPETSLL